jgi:outer membrane protein assembly factor BamD
MGLRRFVIFIFLVLLVVSCSGKQVIRHSERFDPEKAFAAANEQLDKKEYERARTLFLEVKNRDLTRKFAPLAQLKIADSYVKADEPELAVSQYTKFLEEYPDHQYASYAQYQIAMVYFNQIEGPERGYGEAAKALGEFEKLKKIFPRNPYKEIVDLKIEKCRNIIAEYEFLVGKFYYNKGSYNAAVGRFVGLLKRFPDYSKVPEVLFYTGDAFKCLKQKEKASKYLSQLIEKYPNNKLTKNAKKELASLKSKEG